MDIDTLVLRNFLILCKTLNFSRASEQTHVAQPALSRQIKQLEDFIGVSLFLRTKRKVILTAAGRYFQNEAEQLLNQFDHVVKHTKKLYVGQAGEIRIGYTHSALQYFLPDLILSINKLYPEIRFVWLEFNNTRQYEALKSREIDIGFASNPEIDEAFRHMLIARTNFALAMPKDYPIEANNFKGLLALRNERFILPPKAEGPKFVETINSIFTHEGFTPLAIHETPFASTAIRLVESGFGLTIEPVSSLKGYKGIKYIELKDIPQKVENVMLWLPNTEAAFPEIIDYIKHYKINPL
ncbi:LysR substrate-binding domain-containing protein [Dyadobacter chenwenxiniae]|uniref:LysR substrate-binding domain-containing protein n=1 Tax=Dyadobacter chenwenxiniae TaxID=2906456 RepID=A0A9X1TIH8_9BACT|nr:LysR substrate-binding domain-containing protein [Dyadobacter chenwenxiniae]MCF0065529.1 LysR substrate-binding domain-containing protein [Dyadobacter chenwenxiniae]UON85441.1 LysR substrate-binding domain-containing protein [Dyadobacter chenwenxiniae]